jgi:hypothetical protein
VFAFWLIFSKRVFGGKLSGILSWAVASIIGSLAKFLILWLGMTRIFIEFVLKNDAGLAEPQLERMTAMIMANFTWMQLVTATIGCIIAGTAYKVLKPVLFDKIIKAENAE